jgi:hypothetical protein
MTSLTSSVDTASLWLWTGAWRTYPWRKTVAAAARQAGFAAVRALLWVLMLGPFLAAAGARLAARSWVRAWWAAGWAISWTVAAFGAGWHAAGGKDDSSAWV